jgi:hypothetical protein
MNRRTTYRAGLCAGLAAAGWMALAAQAGGQNAAAPAYDGNGNLLAPVGFESWVFVGSNLAMEYHPDAAAMTPREALRAEQQLFHNVYINPEAYAHFVATAEFPEPTILVMQKFQAATKEPQGILASGSFNGDYAGMEVAVKNSARPDGSTTPWAYYRMTGVASAPAEPDDNCETCHKLHASTDNVWVQFYPTLRDLTQ